MSPTSSEPSTRVEERFPGMARAAEHGRQLREERERRRFGRAFAWLVGGLVMLAAIFTVLGALQGPKLEQAQVDAERVTQQSGQQLRLFLNQPVDAIDASALTVEPSAVASVSVQGDLVVVQFDERLRHDTPSTRCGWRASGRPRARARARSSTASRRRARACCTSTAPRAAMTRCCARPSTARVAARSCTVRRASSTRCPSRACSWWPATARAAPPCSNRWMPAAGAPNRCGCPPACASIA